MADTNFANQPLDFNSIRIQLASPDTIRGWSRGEVTKPETINYRSFKPERDGLFCECIFGPVKDWECHCGKYKRIRYRGVVCDRCGVEVTQSKVRRERLGHIELAVPVTHIWFFKSLPSRMGYLLNLSVRKLERIIYYESYVVLDPGDAPDLKSKDLLTEDEVIDLEAEGYSFEVDMGAGAIKKLLSAIDIEDLSAELRTQARFETSVQRKQEALKRLKVVEAFRQSDNQPDWMILDVIPVIPPDLRPLVPLEGGRFATSDLNDLYRRVINRNNRLKKLIEIKAPEVILRNEKRMLQEAVDALFDNGRRSRAVRGDGNRSLKSLSDLLKGKQGRFRQNLLGKRVDYSGRSVIVVDPHLRLYQCGLPKHMALELFKPFIIRRLEEKGLVQTVKSAKKLVERERVEVWDILEEIIQDHCVLLNRAPTLHRLGIQAFLPVLVEGKAIRIHPLVCAAFNADFDGDQMAVHLPLSFEAQIEARVLMLSSNNLLKPADGSPVVVDKPQEIALGLYYLTKIVHGKEDNLKTFSSTNEARMAYDFERIDLHEAVCVRIDGELLTTTVGRVIFNEIMPKDMPFVNELIDDKGIRKVSSEVHSRYGNRITTDFLDGLKQLGYDYATQSGISIAVSDVVVPPEKEELITDAMDEVEKIIEQHAIGAITEGERYNKVIDVWQHTTNHIAQAMIGAFEKAEDGFNSIWIMKDSGARGNDDQIKQLGGMRGLMNKPQKKLTGAIGEIIETPIISSLKEGLTVLEYFISTHGSRKGLADTALKTAEAGYLTRRMVDVSQDVVISESDCGTILGIEMEALKEGEEVVESLSDRIVGRTVLEDVEDPITGERIVDAGVLLNEELADKIADAGIESVFVRSVLTCETRRGVCMACYGRNPATGLPVDIGEAVGVIAAQSVGEPGTQLTLRTFHIGGTSSRIAEQAEIGAKRAGKVIFKHIESVKRDANSWVVVGRNGEIEVQDDQGRVRGGHYHVPHGAVLRVEAEQDVEEDQALYEWDPYNNMIVSPKAGRVQFGDLVEGVTYREEIDETTSIAGLVVIEHRRDRTLSPHIKVVGEDGEELGHYIIPLGARLVVRDGDQVADGDTLAKISRERSKTRDITGGLPRVAELFEARRPKEASVVTEINGSVRFGHMVRGSRVVLVTADEGEEKKYTIPYGRHLRVQEGDRVTAGDRLSEGSVNPHDILAILGDRKVQEYLVDEIQQVYRLQGVKINDKHIETIVRQMLQKVQVTDPGDTNFLEDELVDRFRFLDENDKVLDEGGDPATHNPVLLGITRASLLTESFISAASFQETTRVLTEAAVQGKVDTLMGLKENVIIGHLIPAGTGALKYRDLDTDVVEESQVFEDLAEENKESSSLPPISA